jgi:hypothetical protein
MGAIKAGRTLTWLQLQDIFSLQALGAFNQLELHSLSFIQGAIAITLYAAKVNKDIVVTIFPGDKAKTLGVVEPLYRAAYAITHTTFLG